MATASASPNCDVTICGVCFHKHTDARLLACLHRFCRDCVDQVTDDNGTVRCPLCQHVSGLPENGGAGLPKDFTASQEDIFSSSGLRSCSMCKDGQSSSIPSLWCKKCRVALCDEHAISHVKTPIEGGHSVDVLEMRLSTSSISAQTASPSYTPACPKHKEPLRFYCGACDVTICGDCAIIGDHSRHNPVGYVVDFVEKRKAKVAGKLEELRRVTVKRVEPSLQAVDSVCSELKQRAEEVSSAIREAGKRAIEAVETCVAEQLQEVDDITEGRLKLLEHHRDQLNSHLKAAQNAIQFGQKLLWKRSDSFGEAFFPLIRALETRVVGLISANNLEQCRHHSQIRFRPADDATVTEKIKASLGKVLPCHASPLYSTIEGQLDIVTALNSEVRFTLQAKDENGRTLIEGGDIITTKWCQSSENTYPSVSVKDNDNGTYTICCSPAPSGMYQLEVLVNGKVIPRRMSITHAKSAWDAAKSHSSISVSDDKQKATKMSRRTGDFSVVGCTVLRHGRHTWKVQIAQNKKIHVLGIVTKPLSNSREGDCNNVALGWDSYNFGCARYRGGVKSDGRRISWSGGDMFELCLDCDHHTLQIRNLRSGEMSTLSNLPDEEYYQFASLYQQGNSVQFVD